MTRLQGYLRDKNNNQLFLDENYSTDEQVIGTWINGKPLYRKVVQGITPAIGDDTTNHSWVSNLDTVIDIEGWILYGGTYQFFIGKSQPPSIDDEAVSQITRLIVSPNKTFQFLIADNPLLRGRYFTVIITYTKTTD